jgi:hypothetical protein
MIVTPLLVYSALIGASFIAWKKYDDKFLLWCIKVGLFLLVATIWQYVAINVLSLPPWLELVNFLAIEALRFLIIVLLLVAGFRIFKSSK